MGWTHSIFEDDPVLAGPFARIPARRWHRLQSWADQTVMMTGDKIAPPAPLRRAGGGYLRRYAEDMPLSGDAKAEG